MSPHLVLRNLRLLSPVRRPAGRGGAAPIPAETRFALSPAPAQSMTIATEYTLGRPTGVTAAELGPERRPRWVLDGLRGATGRGVRVAVVDSGWDPSVHDPRVGPGVGLVAPRDATSLPRGGDGDVLGHGTACIHQVLRIAPDATVLPVRVFGARLECPAAALLAAIRWAVEERVDIVNLSLGTTRADLLRPLYAACEHARRAGTLVVAAGGNDGPATYPSVFEHVLGVEKGHFASPFHFRYRPGAALEVEAWGQRQPVIGLGGQVTLATGTSVAAPNVTGIVALLRERHPGAGVDEVRALLARYAVA